MKLIKKLYPYIDKTTGQEKKSWNFYLDLGNSNIVAIKPAIQKLSNGQPNQKDYYLLLASAEVRD